MSAAATYLGTLNPQQRCAAGRDGEVEVGEDQALAATAGQGANREHGVIPGDRGGEIISCRGEGNPWRDGTRRRKGTKNERAALHGMGQEHGAPFWRLPGVGSEAASIQPRGHCGSRLE